MQQFRDRHDAGRQLADSLTAYRGRSDVVVLGLPRGGIPVAAEVARALDAPLDVFVVRKLGLPGHPELAMGAVGPGGTTVRNDVVAAAGVSESTFDAVRDRELAELQRRESAYRDGRDPVPVTGRTVIVVDDGLATGATMLAAVQALRQLGPSRVVVAVPVGAPSSCAELAAHADEVVCPNTPASFAAVGAHYADFRQTSDEEVRAALDEARQGREPRQGRQPREP